MLKKILLWPFMLLLIFHCNIAKSDEIALEELLSNIDGAISSFDDYSCKFVTIAGESDIMAELSAMMEKSTGQALPREQEMLVWIKNPNLMKTKVSSVDMVVEKEGEEVYRSYRDSKTNMSDKAKMPRNSWPAYPSPESELMKLTMHLDVASSHSIKKDEMGYVLTINILDANSKNVYYIDDTNWMIYKVLLFKGDKLSMTYEWRDIELNVGLSDDFFKL